MSTNRQLTRLLNQWRTGDEALLNEIIPEIYDELHRVASWCMRSQPSHHTLQATALVNEAFCQLREVKSELRDRGHFIGIVGRLMRQILVDHARAKNSLKRGGGAPVLPLHETPVAAESPSEDVLALEELLTSMQKTDPRKVQIAELMYFCGATYEETARTLGISGTTVHREMRMLKALLAHSLSND